MVEPRLKRSKDFDGSKWETSKASTEEVKELQERLSRVVVFEDEEIDRAYNRSKAAPSSKFIGEGLPLDFIQNELRIRGNVQGMFHVSFLSEGFLSFDLPSEEVQAWILVKGSWTLVGLVNDGLLKAGDQILILEGIKYAKLGFGFSYQIFQWSSRIRK